MLEAPSPWGVAIEVDGEPTVATGFAESLDQFGPAGSIEVPSGESSWIAGIIGDTLPRGPSPWDDIDLYRLVLPSGDHYALKLQVLSESFGGSLDPAVALFDQSGRLLAFNDDALIAPNFSEPRLDVGLDGGTYFVAVAAGGELSRESDTFDLAELDSAYSSRGSSGPYLLQITARPDSTAPEVLRISPDPSAPWTEPVTITVQFSEAMDLRGLEQGASLVRSDGIPISLRPIHYDSDTFTVTYLLGDRPTPGDYLFTLDAAKVIDRAWNSLTGTAPDGDFVVQLRFEPPEFLTTELELSDSPLDAQDLGPLYIQELRSGVQITGSVTGDVSDHDFYRFQVTHAGFYTFRLRPGEGSTTTAILRLHDANGTQLLQGFRFPGMGSVLFRFLRPGEYLVQVDGGTVAGDETYVLRIQAASETEIPLVDQNLNPLAISVLLRTHDGERPPETEDSEPPQTEIVAASESVAQAVSSLPAVGSHPVGRATLEPPDSRSLAWANTDSDKAILSAGFALREANKPILKFSVERVSGSFHDPLPDAISEGVDSSLFSQRSLREILSIIREAGVSVPMAQAQGIVPDSSTGSGDIEIRTTGDSAEAAEETVRTASSSPTFALGMVASLGAASALTVPNRRQSSRWVQWAFQWLGLV